MMLRNFHIEHLWVYAVLGSCFGYLCTLPLQQYDSWHYLKAGEKMVYSRQLLDHDTFTFTIAGTQFVNVHWGAQVILYCLYRLGGIPFLEFVHACGLTLAFTLIFLLAWRYSANLRIAAGTTFIAFLVSATNLALRPQGFSAILFVLTLYLLKSGRYWFVPPIMFLWCNIHGAFILGLVLIGIEWLGSIRPGLAGQRVSEDTHPTPAQGSSLIFHPSSLLFTLLVSFLMTLANPRGMRLYPAIVAAESVSRASLITEWDPPTLHDPTGILFFAALLTLLGLRNACSVRWNRGQLLTIILFTLLALRAQRAVIWWALATAPLFAETMKHVFTRRCEMSKTQRALQKNARTHLWGVNWAIALLFSIFLIGCLPWLKQHNPLLPSLKRRLIAPDTPVSLACRLRNQPQSRRIFNNFSWGGYFIWALRDDQKVFFDPRVLMFPARIINDYLLITNGHASWQRLLDHYRVDTLALGKEDQQPLLPLVETSGKWRRVYGDSLGAIFVRRCP